MNLYLSLSITGSNSTIRLSKDDELSIGRYFISLPCCAITAQKTDSRRQFPSNVASIMSLHTNGPKYLVVGWKMIGCKDVG